MSTDRIPHPASRRPRVHALAVTHENNWLHVRSTTEGYPRVGWALAGTDLTWEADLAWEDQDEAGAGWAVVTGIRVPPPVVADPADPADRHWRALAADAAAGRDTAVARALAAAGVNTLAYTWFYDPTRDGPVVKYRRVPGGDDPDPTRFLACVDYGYESGCWLFGHPQVLEAAADGFAEQRMTPWVVECGGTLEALCVPADDLRWRTVVGGLRGLGYLVLEEEFRPA